MRIWFTIAVIVCGCATRMPVPPVVEPLPMDGLRVRLHWWGPVDLDLYVTDPRGETFYYANRGRVMIVGDERCTGIGGMTHEERAGWTDPMQGRYRVGVDFPDACGTSATEVAFRVTVEDARQQRTLEGLARLGQREPAVLEFDVPLVREMPR